MAERPERIERLVERSSLGTTEARRARAQVSTEAAKVVLRRVSKSAVTGKYVAKRGTSAR